MKKKIIIVVSIILGICFIFSVIYAIDMNRMNHQKPVVFSTWGYDYAPPEVNGTVAQTTNETVTEKKTVNPKQAIYHQSGDYIAITLPEEWNYEIMTESSEQYEYGIKFYLANDAEKYAALYSYKTFFGVCGTGLECKDLVANDGTSISVGYYGNDWSFMTFGYKDKEIVAMNHGLEGETAKQAIEILKTIEYKDKEEMKSFIGTVLESTTTYMVVEPSEDEEERKVADKIRINYGVDFADCLLGMVGSKVVVTYSGDVKETYPAEIDTRDVRHGYSDFELSVVESTQSEKKKILNNSELYKYNVKFDLYYYGIDEVTVKVDNKEMTLEKALKDGYLTLEGILAKANKDVREVEEIYAKAEEHQSMPLILPRVNTYRDGGTREYRYDYYTIIKCHTVEGNKDMYICKPGTTLKDLNI